MVSSVPISPTGCRQRGIEVTIPTRRRERTKALIIQPNVLMPEVGINSEEALVSLMQGQDAVINLVGILHSRDVVLPYSKDFAEAHVELPKKIVAACKKAGVRRLVHMERAGCRPQGPVGISLFQGRRRGHRDGSEERTRCDRIPSIGDLRPRRFLPDDFGGALGKLRSSPSVSATPVSSRSGLPMSPMPSSIAWAIRKPSARPTILSAPRFTRCANWLTTPPVWSAATRGSSPCLKGLPTCRPG